MQDGRRDISSLLSRSSLLAELHAKGIPSLVPEEVKQILGLLEAEFVPLELCHRLQPLLAKVNDFSGSLSAAAPISRVDLQQFVPSLQNVRPGLELGPLAAGCECWAAARLLGLMHGPGVQPRAAAHLGCDLSQDGRDLVMPAASEAF